MSQSRRSGQRDDPFAELPASLGDTLRDQWDVYRQASAHAGLVPSFRQDLFRVLLRVWASSDFVVHSCLHSPGLLYELLDSGDLLLEYEPGEMAAQVAAIAGSCRDEAALMLALRTLRRREMVRIAWRDLAGWASLEEVLRDLSALADACIEAALERVTVFEGRRVPHTETGRRQKLVVLAMGKLGACELNFSSDIDLIFAFPEDGEFGGRQRESYAEYFTRIGHGLIRVLSDTDQDGMVFRVDMRLRPFGDSGPLVMSFDALEDYYQSQGRDWERYAMIKARPVTGELEDREQLMQMVQPFVYRRYLDYGAFHALREMKAMIARQVERKGLHDNIKLGPGGIREIEFLVQAFQLIRGGREPLLRERSLLAVLARLPGLDLLPGYASDQLAEAYRFLRRAENRLQELADRQVHRLPNEENDRLRLALAMDYPDWGSFLSALEVHRQQVSAWFAQVVAAPHVEHDEQNRSQPIGWADVWEGRVADEGTERMLVEAGYTDASQARYLIEGFRDCYAVRTMGPQGRQRLDRLMPLLLSVLAGSPHAADVLPRLLALLEAIAGRSAYIALLAEHPIALSQLIRLMEASPWIAHQLTAMPVLLDELLDARSLYAPPDRVEMERVLKTQLAQLEADDLERQMDVLREARQAAVLRVAAADITGVIPVTRVSDHLTGIAESVLARVVALSYEQMVLAHGRPSIEQRSDSETPGFGVIAYGKLGGHELGYGSDLDLVFLHLHCEEGEVTGGRTPVDNAVFFARVGQRIIHMLNTTTAAGVLYEIDMRLRPSGASGLLVSELESFAGYQRSEAWTWEHQALVRARSVAGDPALAGVFDSVRREVLAQVRDEKSLQADILDMAGKMRAELDRSEPGRFDLKYGRGGVTDIEFMIQYKVLSQCHEFPDLAAHTGNIPLLATIADAGALEAAEAETLGLIYKTYRERLHQLSLLELPALIDASELEAQRGMVLKIWNKLMGTENGD